MAARSTNQLQLHFRHLTGAIAVKIKNTLGDALVIDHITITSSGYQLSGSRGFNFAHIDTIGPITTSDEAKRKIVMYFDIEELSLASGASKTVLLPVPPVGGDNKFTVVISGHNQGKRYNYSNTQNTANNLARNVMGFATADLSSNVTTGRLFEGTGAGVSDPYLIKSASDFKLMAEAISNKWSYGGDYWLKSYRLENDIDMSGISIDAISNYGTGTFDGNNHTIKNVSVNGVEVSGFTYCGLFSSIGGSCVVKKLKLENVLLQINGTHEKVYLGAICGGIAGACTLEDCIVDGLTVSANVTTNNPIGIGGIVGLCKTAATITRCSLNGSMFVTSSNYDVRCGSIVGLFNNNNNTMTLSGCNWEGTININTNNKILHAGGLVGGLQYNEKIIANDSCTSNGSIEAAAASGSYLGKYVGYANASHATVTLSSCSGTVTLKLNGVEQTVKDVGNR